MKEGKKERKNVTPQPLGGDEIHLPTYILTHYTDFDRFPVCKLSLSP